MFGSHPSFGTGGHLLSAQVMKRLWKKQVSIDQLNIVKHMHFYIYFKVCKCEINFSSQKRNYNNIKFKIKEEKVLGWYYWWADLKKRHKEIFSRLYNPKIKETFLKLAWNRNYDGLFLPIIAYVQRKRLLERGGKKKRGRHDLILSEFIGSLLFANY